MSNVFLNDEGAMEDESGGGESRKKYLVFTN